MLSRLVSSATCSPVISHWAAPVNPPHLQPTPRSSSLHMKHLDRLTTAHLAYTSQCRGQSKMITSLN
ncbi:hypothetical protein BGZ61DRAFT_447791 [Ilyonectria robusta]|uniref:uncharacterized protein n=1 Tax=Ilyonectria robusta TaxID=1079257 RepID=UPI001E8E63B3|nr:uncharacterized protein BGZ61DRAFT_447791 [Ilyonectria robusta]KAH8721997.1 hypothetical protein BGZ61DRAFT_447791 [Ilyonectria robusta]